MRCLSLFLFAIIFSFDAAAQTPIDLNLDRTIKIVGDGKSTQFCAHEANDTQSRTVGLMFQKKLPSKAGMIFDFQVENVVHMWMRNTVLPLDMVFVGSNGKIVKIQKNTTPFSLDIITSGVPARYVLELNAGIADEFNLNVGNRFEIAGTGCVLD